MVNTTGTNNSETIAGTTSADNLSGGFGNDTINGLGGNDSITGGPAALTSVTEHLAWSLQGNNNTSIARGFTQTTGTTQVSFTYADTATGGSALVETGQAMYVAPGETYATNSAAYLSRAGGTGTTTVGLAFNPAAGSGNASNVSNVNFRINDIDMAGWQDQIKIFAYDAAGNAVPVTITMAAGSTDVVSGNTITAGNVSDNPNEAGGSALINIAGPVQRISIVYANLGTAAQRIDLTDVYFSATKTDDDSLSGGDGLDSIYGGAGNDSIWGDAGNDLIQGGTGNDSIYGGADSDQITGDAGNDLIYGDSADPAAAGAADTVAGGDGNDTVYGGAGADSITGDAGTDLLYGGDGADRLYGGTEADTLYGDAGADSLFGGDGNDSLFGGTEADTLSGDLGDDTLSGDAGNDSLLGGAGNDKLDGGADDDRLFGEAGNDALVGGDGNDYLDGGTENDTLTGGVGVDTILGGTGDDYIYLTSTDTIDGGLGSDTLDATLGSTAEVVTFTTGTGGTIDNGSTVTNVETFLSDAGADRYDAANATISLTISSGADADTVTSGSGNDTLYGGTGADVLAGGAGNDAIYGGDDADRIVIAAASGTDVVDGGNGGTDVDTLDLGALTTPVTAVLTGAEAGSATTSGGSVSFTEIERLVTGSGADAVTASASSLGVWVDTGAGNDTLTGSGFADTLAMGDGADSVMAGGGNDLVDGGLGNDTLSGEAGADSLTGGDGADVLYGGSEADTLSGDAGNDTLDGGTGSDQFTYVAAGFGDDTVIGGEDAASTDIDYLHADLTSDVQVTYSGLEAGLMTSAGVGNGTVSFSEIEGVWTGAGNDVIDARANPGGGWYQTNDGADTVLGGAGVDHIYSGSGNDQIDGGGGADQIFGGAGDDWIKGGLGDTVDGGTGDHDTLDLSAWGWARTNVIYSAADPQSGTVEFLAPDGTVTGSMAFSNIEKVMPCFTPGTRIETARGAAAIEDLQPGDLILTRDNGMQPLRWIGNRDLSLADLIVQPRLKPMRIAAGSLGAGLPERDLTVSPQHRMLIEGARAEMLFGEPEVLVAARHLPEATQSLPHGVTYIHLLFDAHEIIRAEGAWTESFQPASRMMSEMEAETRAEIEALFPDLQHSGFPAARLSLKAHEARVLLAA